jgi:hypothetical protein
MPPSGEAPIRPEAQARKACACRRSVDRADHGIWNATQVDDRGVQCLGPAAHLRRQVDRVVFDPGFEAVDVPARAEGLAGAGEDQRSQRCLVGEPGERRPQVEDHLGAHRVEALGTVEGEGADLPVDLYPQGVQLGRAQGLGAHLTLSVSGVKLAGWPGAYPLNR